MSAKLPLFPHGTAIDSSGQLTLAGQRASDLADRFGTPLYLYDLATIRRQIATYRQALAGYPGPTQLTYASKAFLCSALAQLLTAEGVGFDVASAGEIFIARRGGADPAHMHLHGNNKCRATLEAALAAGVGCLVVDNAAELDLLHQLVNERQQPVNLWLRITPDVGVETHHRYTVTGTADSKFGFGLAEARSVAKQLLLQPAGGPFDDAQDQQGSRGAEETSSPQLPSPFAPLLTLTGLHLHLGSHFHEAAPMAAAVERLLDLANSLRETFGWEMRELSPGGGWGVPYHPDDPPMPVEPFLRELIAAIEEGCRRRSMPLPKLVLEPGRSLVAQAGVALYRVGGRKVTSSGRVYVSVDGGLADNPRPALYQARYTALLTNRAAEVETETVAIAGPFCESGDVLIQTVELPQAQPGDLLAVPVSGAYQLSMGSNYNAALRPAVVFLDENEVRLVQRRETFEDLVGREV